MPHANLTQVSLCDVPVNQVCTLVKWGALDEPTVQRLNQTGILLGVSIRVAEQTISGPVVVVLNDSRLAIGTEIAKELKVVLGERNAS